MVYVKRINASSVFLIIAHFGGLRINPLINSKGNEYKQNVKQGHKRNFSGGIL